MESALTELFNDKDVEFFLTLEINDKKKQIENSIFMIEESYHDVCMTIKTYKMEFNHLKKKYDELCDKIDSEFFENNIIDTSNHDLLSESSLQLTEYKSKLEELLRQERFIEQQLNKFKSFHHRFLSSSSTFGFT